MNSTKFCVSLLLLTFTLQACKNMKAAVNEKVVFKDGSMPFILTDQQILVVSEINGNNDTMLFDLGASSTTIFDPSLIQKGQFISNYKISVKLPDNSKIVSQEKTYKVNNPLFSSDNMVLHTITLPQRPCGNGYMKNIMGNKLFKRNKKTLLLSFEDSTISFLQEKELENILSLKNYGELPVKIHRGGIYLVIESGKFKGEYLLDTGNGAVQLLTNNKEFVNESKAIVIEGALLLDASNKIKSDNKNYILPASQFPLVKDGEVKMLYNENTKGNNLGLNFLKKFNWIIDFKNKRLYYKQIDFTPNDPIVIPDFYATHIVDHKLTIIIKKDAANKYEVGDEIVSVDGISITEENACEQMQKLNSSKEDWSKFNIGIRKKQVAAK